MRDYLNGDIDSSCGSLSREDPMLLGIPRRVVPPLIICDSSVRDAQMTRYFTWKKQEESALNQESRFRHCSQKYLKLIWLYGGCYYYLLRTERALKCLTTSLGWIKATCKIIWDHGVHYSHKHIYIFSFEQFLMLIYNVRISGWLLDVLFLWMWYSRPFIINKLAVHGRALMFTLSFDSILWHTDKKKNTKKSQELKVRCVKFVRNWIQYS